MDLYNVLWEDLSTTQNRIQQTLTALQALQHAIEEGQIEQPTRQDSKRLNRMSVLADLLFHEIEPWTDAHPNLIVSGNGNTPEPLVP